MEHQNSPQTCLDNIAMFKHFMDGAFISNFNQPVFLSGLKCGFNIKRTGKDANFLARICLTIAMGDRHRDIFNIPCLLYTSPSPRD